MTGLISIIYALQTSACYLRLGSTGTEVEQGRPSSQRVRRALLAAGATPGQKCTCQEVRVVSPRSQDRNQLHVSVLFPACHQCSHSHHGRALPPSPPEVPAHANEQPPGPVPPAGGPSQGYLSQRDTGYVSWASNKSFGTFRLSAIFASRLSKPERPN